MLDQQLLPSLDLVDRRCSTCGGRRLLEPEHGTLTTLHYRVVCMACSRDAHVVVQRPGAHHVGERALAWDDLSEDTKPAPRQSIPDSVRFANCPHGPGRQLTADGLRCLLCRRQAQRDRDRERRETLGPLPRASYPPCNHPEPRRLDRYRRCRDCTAAHHRDYYQRTRGRDE